MKIYVTKYRLNPDRVFAGTRGSYGVEKLSFEFCTEWDVSTVSVIFYPVRGKPVEIPYFSGAEIDIPSEVMKNSGESRFIVSGSLIDNGELKKKIVTLEGKIEVAYTPDDKGANAKDVTPDTYDLFLSQAKLQMESALAEAAESGMFNGEDGKDGVDGKDGKDGEKGERGEAFTYEDFTPEQLEALRGEKGDSGVFVREEDGDTPTEDDKIEVDLTEEAEEPDIFIPDSLTRDGNSVYLMCDGSRIGEPFTVYDGEDGRDFRILGYYSTVDALSSAVADPEIGDAYGVGENGSYVIYVFDGVTNGWINNGSIAGVAGADGVGIKSIVQTTASTEDGGSNVWTATLTDGTTSTFAVKNGSKGSAGTNGKDGTNGTNGTDGVGISKMEQTTIGSNGGASTWKATLTDGTTYTLSVLSGRNGANGTDGTNGENGVDGYTPVRGTDYWTEEDQTAIINAVLSNFTDASEVAM